jgi:PadR family transcriptional regulator, regulatory protein PadR
MPLNRLSPVEELILEHLSVRDMFGLELVGVSDGRLKRGTVYVTLGRMEEKGLVESRQEPLPAGAIGLPRRLYRPTAFGRRLLTATRVMARMLAPETGS